MKIRIKATGILLLFFINSSFSENQNVINEKFLDIGIVLWGEQTYADCAVFDDNIKIIKKLHKQYNFNIIVFENGFYDNFEAQQIIKGQVFDAETNEPIGYTDVYYRNNNKSVVSNSDGTYLIDKSKNQNDFIFFSSIGYDTDSIKISTINSFQKTYLKQNQNINNIDIVEKGKELTASEILKNARKKIKENYIQKPYNQVLLCKSQVYNATDDELLSNEQALINTYNKKGINSSNKVQSNFYGKINHLINTTNSFNTKRSAHAGIKNIWASLSRDLVLSKTNVLYKTSSYNLKKEGILKYDGQDVYKISFINNSPGGSSTGYGDPAVEKSSGYIYIDKETFAVLKYEHCITRLKHHYEKYKYKVQTTHKINESYKKVGGFYYINFLKETDKSDSFLEDDTFNGTKYYTTSITSQDIQTENVAVINIPLQDIVRGYKYNTEDEYWKERDVDSKISIDDFNCE